MYFIARGDCLVNIREHDRKEKIAVRVLCEGDHFGEIGLIYNTNRTASVQSRNYNTLAGLRRDMFRIIDQEYPEFKKQIIKYLFKYNYRKKEFIKEAFDKILFLKNLNKTQFHHAMYILKSNFWEPGKILLKAGDDTNSFIIVEHGSIELYSEFEGNEFILEKLPAGSIINPRVLFMEDRMYVNVRANKETGAHTLELGKNEFELLSLEYEDLKKKILMYESQILKQEKRYPLDYIYNGIPEASTKVKTGALKRENILKNIVYNRILEIQEQKRKPKLSDILKFFSKFDTSKPEIKDMLVEKIILLYSNKPMNLTTQEDAKYERIMTSFDRLKKSLTHQHESLIEIDIKVGNLIKRRLEREQAGPEYFRLL